MLASDCPNPPTGGNKYAKNSFGDKCNCISGNYLDFTGAATNNNNCIDCAAGTRNLKGDKCYATASSPCPANTLPAAAGGQCTCSAGYFKSADE